MARNGTPSRDPHNDVARETEVKTSASSGSHRRRLPERPPTKSVAYGIKVDSFTGNQHRTTTEWNRSNCDDVVVCFPPICDRDLHSGFTGSGLKSLTSDPVSDFCAKRPASQGYSDYMSRMRMISWTTDTDICVDEARADNQCREEESGCPDARNFVATELRSETSSQSQRHCPSLFTLMRTCQLISVTLVFPGPPDNDVIDDVIRMTETNLTGAVALREKIAPRSAFTLVSQASTTPTKKHFALEDFFPDDRLVVVEEVRQNAVIPDHNRQLLPGDIIVELNGDYVLGKSLLNVRSLVQSQPTDASSTQFVVARPNSSIGLIRNNKTQLCGQRCDDLHISESNDRFPQRSSSDYKRLRRQDAVIRQPSVALELDDVSPLSSLGQNVIHGHLDVSPKSASPVQWHYQTTSDVDVKPFSQLTTRECYDEHQRASTAGQPLEARQVPCDNVVVSETRAQPTPWQNDDDVQRTISQQEHYQHDHQPYRDRCSNVQTCSSTQTLDPDYYLYKTAYDGAYNMQRVTAV